jgi:hypothetical protein
VSIRPIEVVTVTAGQIAGTFVLWVALTLVAVGGVLWAVWPHLRRGDSDGDTDATEVPARAVRRTRRRPHTGVVHDCPAWDTTLELPTVVDGDR